MGAARAADALANLTPWMRQYLDIKERHRDAILFFRMGDFYEMFFEDAEVAARILDIALTCRNRESDSPIPMCGVPHHAASFYINRLVAAGRKVAICEQMEEPGPGKKLLRREVVWVAAPGLTLDQEALEAKANNFLAAAWVPREIAKPFGLACLDLSTGEFRCTQAQGLEAAAAELARIEPAQLLLPEGQGTALVQALEELAGRPFVEELEAAAFEEATARRFLFERLAPGRMSALVDFPEATRACGALLAYLERVGGGRAEHVREIRPYRLADYMLLDEFTQRNLELFETLAERSRRGSLLDVIDKTITAMGGRKLRHWLKYPLLSLQEIARRQDAVAELVEEASVRARMRQVLDTIADLERLVARVAMRRATPRDLAALKESLRRLPDLLEPLAGTTSERLRGLATGIDQCADVCELIEQALVADPPLAVREGGYIREGYSAELDELIGICRDVRGWIARLEAAERERTGIGSLKVGYNKVFGYYLEVTKPHLAKVPEDYIRKQTVATGERFVTQALKDQEARILSAEQVRLKLEIELFSRLTDLVAAQSARLKETAERVAELDALAALAQTAAEHGYVRPRVSLSERIDIRGGRHPVVERLLAERFTPNDVFLDDTTSQLLIITGPNMAGKSTVLRQVALIVLLAQMGGFVPADEAEIGLVERIFTRVGAMDSLARGQSTFMVEMTETAAILAGLSERSLVLLDEIGRGTSTFDGLAIAWAVAEHLNGWRGRGVKTLFATHYHELTRLAEKRPRVRNLNVAAREVGGSLHFIYKLVPGAASRSYGVQVAKLAGLPRAVTARAAELLSAIEAGELERAADSAAAVSGERQFGLFERRGGRVIERLKAVDANQLTPLEALNLLHELKQELDKP